MPDGIIVDRETWKNIDDEERFRMVYNTLRSIDDRLKKLERRPVFDRVASFVGGIVGGILAFFYLKWSG